MSHKGIRQLIESTAKSLQDDIQYSYGKDTDFNQDKKKSSLMVNTSPLVSVPSYRVNGVQNYMKEWRVEMAFYKFDKEESIGSEYARILDEVDPLIDNFINQLNFFSVGAHDITLSGFNQQPFIKATADILTGWILTFNILAMDDYNYCVDC